jgi:hypothetical protein
MSRNTLFIRLMLLAIVVASLAVMLGGEPWGPN